MVSITLSISDDFRKELKKYSWINWSEVAREEVTKKIILEKFLRKGSISDEDRIFCEKIDWHLVDELPIKKEFIRKLSEIKREKSIKLKKASDIFG